MKIDVLFFQQLSSSKTSFTLENSMIWQTKLIAPIPIHRQEVKVLLNRLYSYENVVGKRSMCPDFKQCNKLGLIFGMSDSAVSGSFVYPKQVAYAIANTPQSQPLFCY